MLKGQYPIVTVAETRVPEVIGPCRVLTAFAEIVYKSVVPSSISNLWPESISRRGPFFMSKADQKTIFQYEKLHF